MKTQFSAVLIIILLLGVSSTAAAQAQQVITPQGSVPQNQHVQTQQPQQFNNQPIPLQDVATQDPNYNSYQPASIDLNSPSTNPSSITNNNVIGLEQQNAQTQQPIPLSTLPINCASGAFVYQQNVLTGQVSTCLCN